MKPLAASVAEPRDNQLARKLRQAGHKNALRIVIECRHRHAGVIPVSLGVALQEQESGGRNIFGADQNAPFTHEPVTKERVLKLVEHVRAGGISNGVGPLQLTFLPFIEEANRDGGAWKPSVNIATGLNIVAGHVKKHGIRGGLAAYNAGAPQSKKGLKYAKQVMDRQDRIRPARRLTSASSSPLLEIREIMASRPRTFVLRPTHMRGQDIGDFQRQLNDRYEAWSINKRIAEDDDYGKDTRDAAREVCIGLGIQLTAMKKGVTPALRTKIRRLDRRTDAEKARSKTKEARGVRARLRKQFAASAAGVQKFDDVEVAAWIVPSLRWARNHGWKGSVTSGFRTCDHQKAVAAAFAARKGKTVAELYPHGPCASNHVGKGHPRGAVDVTEFEQLARVLRNNPNTPKLVWGGPVINDEVHFSADGH